MKLSWKEVREKAEANLKRAESARADAAQSEADRERAMSSPAVQDAGRECELCEGSGSIEVGTSRPHDGGEVSVYIDCPECQDAGREEPSRAHAIIQTWANVLRTHYGDAQGAEALESVLPDLPDLPATPPVGAGELPDWVVRVIAAAQEMAATYPQSTNNRAIVWLDEQLTAAWRKCDRWKLIAGQEQDARSTVENQLAAARQRAERAERDLYKLQEVEAAEDNERKMRNKFDPARTPE